MTEDQNHNRIRLIDVSKGAAITGVVLAHSGVALFGTGDGAMNPILELFYSFLYMFFFISGYLYKPGRTCKENIGRTVKKLFIVFILCTVVLTTIMWVYLVILGYDCPASEFMDTLIASLIGKKTFLPMDNCPSGIFVGYPDISFAYYFIIFLIGAYLVFYPLIDKVRSSLKKTAAVVAVLIVCEFVLTSVLPVHLPYSIEGCLVPAALLFIGAYASQFKILEWIESNSLSWRNAAILVVMLVIAILACTYIPLTVGLSISRFGIYGPASVFVCLITILSSGYVLMNGANILGYIPFLSKALEYCGKHSLSILMLHAFYLKLIVAPFIQLPRSVIIVPLETLPQVFAGVVISIALSLITSYVLTYIVEWLRKMHQSDCDRHIQK